MTTKFVEDTVSERIYYRICITIICFPIALLLLICGNCGEVNDLKFTVPLSIIENITIEQDSKGTLYHSYHHHPFDRSVMYFSRGQGREYPSGWRFEVVVSRGNSGNGGGSGCGGGGSGCGVAGCGGISGCGGCGCS